MTFAHFIFPILHQPAMKTWRLCLFAFFLLAPNIAGAGNEELLMKIQSLSGRAFFFTHNPPRWEMGVLRR